MSSGSQKRKMQTGTENRINKKINNNPLWIYRNGKAGEVVFISLSIHTLNRKSIAPCFVI